ncbi:MAG: leucyl/phenylalanyl-tRNA--protein transferase [Gammaproteobacteria bacterium]|nr:leucyl/phenylalanyl-tRNA--protein transferase [Gammaproteobacteria bacterium]MBT8052801.1 leucyl/phenylalanyl-tRNA--protein transferase [Gammaproteobacteria bacterium]
MNSFELPRLGSDADAPFPPTTKALASPNGLLAWGGDLQPTRVLKAYRAGIFPWYSEGQPILWWSPAPRCVLFPAEVHLSRRTRRRYNSGVYHLTADTAFAAVMSACAEPRGDDNGTWITPEMLHAYTDLHQAGHAHSVEVWENDRLTGGIYGLSIGSVFFGESMFSRQSDASKIALVALCRQLQEWGYGLLDCQVGNPHLYRMGAEQLSRRQFEDLLQKLTEDDRPEQSWLTRFKPDKRW